MDNIVTIVSDPLQIADDKRRYLTYLITVSHWQRGIQVASVAATRPDPVRVKMDSKKLSQSSALDIAQASKLHRTGTIAGRMIAEFYGRNDEASKARLGRTVYSVSRF